MHRELFLRCEPWIEGKLKPTQDHTLNLPARRGFGLISSQKFLKIRRHDSDLLSKCVKLPLIRVSIRQMSQFWKLFLKYPNIPSNFIFPWLYTRSQTKHHPKNCVDRVVIIFVPPYPQHKKKVCPYFSYPHRFWYNLEKQDFF